jgi:hypothetical protein
VKYRNIPVLYPYLRTNTDPTEAKESSNRLHICPCLCLRLAYQHYYLPLLLLLPTAIPSIIPCRSVADISPPLQNSKDNPTIAAITSSITFSQSIRKQSEQSLPPAHERRKSHHRRCFPTPTPTESFTQDTISNTPPFGLKYQAATTMLSKSLYLRKYELHCTLNPKAPKPRTESPPLL